MCFTTYVSTIEIFQMDSLKTLKIKLYAVLNGKQTKNRISKHYTYYRDRSVFPSPYCTIVQYFNFLNTFQSMAEYQDS